MIQLTQQGDYGHASALGLTVVGLLMVFAAIYLALLSKDNTR